MLEIIDKGNITEAHPAPLLFVHGAWHGAWCWDEHFLDFFAERGYRAVAVSLRGHGRSTGPKWMQLCSVADFVSDVELAASTLPTQPVIIGHSMGGFVAQKYLERNDAPAGVLMASIPSRGARAFLVRFLRHNPRSAARSLLTTKTLHGISTPQQARERFYSPYTSESDVARFTAMLGEEFCGKLLVDTMFKLPCPEQITTPLLVLGGELDAAFAVDEVRATARTYDTEAEIFAQMGHNMMLEPEWVLVAERISSWLAHLAL